MINNYASIYYNLGNRYVCSNSNDYIVRIINPFIKVKQNFLTNHIIITNSSNTSIYDFNIISNGDSIYRKNYIRPNGHIEFYYNDINNIMITYKFIANKKVNTLYIFNFNFLEYAKKV